MNLKQPKKSSKKSQFSVYLENKSSNNINKTITNIKDQDNSIIWYRKYDETYKSYYLLNNNTNESIWEEDFRKYKSEQYNLITILNHNSIQINNQIDQAATDDLEIEENSSNDSKTKQSLLSSINVDYSNNTDFKLYKIYIIVNAIIFEAPLCVIEGSFRCIIIMITYLFLLIYQIILISMKIITFNEMIIQLKTSFFKYFYELMMSFNSIIILVIPGMIYCVYRDFSTDNDWNLHPIPTLIGFVDIRRFGMITYGGGSSASNCDVILNNNNNNNNVTNQDDGSIIIHNDNSLLYNQDSWKGVIILIPRNIIKDISFFIQGVNRIESFNINL